MKELTVTELFDLDETIAGEIFEGITYPWEVLPKIGEFIVNLGNTLPEDEYEKAGENIWIARSAKVASTACINGPTIIGKDAEIRHCAFIRGNALVGEGAVVGNSTELKNVILFNKVQVPHYNYVGDSILGYKSHMGAGSITSNVKSDKTLATVNTPEGKMETGLKKIRRHARRLCGSGLWKCSESGNRCRKKHQYLSSFHGARLCRGRKHLQKTGGSCREAVIAWGAANQQS